MKVAIVGSRGYPRLDLVTKYVQGLPRDTVIVSGGAPGVDECAAAAASLFGLQVIEFIPEWDKYKPADPRKKNPAGMIRNTEIIKEADRVVAFHSAASKGTANSIMKARKAGKPVIVFDAQGNEVKP